MSKIAGISRCRCCACGRIFSSTHSFDLHRVGNHTVQSPHYGRRCLSAEEMLAKGMLIRPFDTGSDFSAELALKGWQLIDNGYWISEAYRTNPTPTVES